MNTRSFCTEERPARYYQNHGPVISPYTCGDYKAGGKKVGRDVVVLEYFKKLTAGEQLPTDSRLLKEDIRL